MKTLKQIAFIVLICSFFALLRNNTQAQTVVDKEKNKAFLDSIKQNPSGVIHFIDNQEVEELFFYEMLLDGKLNTSGIVCYGREAIIQYGERYRHGIIFFNSKKAEDEGH